MNCTNCNIQSQPNSKFCQGCGTPLAQQQSPQQPGGFQGGNYHGGPYPYPFPPPPPQNGMAIAGLILAFIFPLLGLIFSILGLNKAKQMNGEGHGLAMAGLVISIVYMIINIVAIVLMLVFLQDFIEWVERMATYYQTI
ncbi:MAG: hypothetical protein FWE16_02850 [Firmicutes bacterium]|nr:hypothetical protein [Bacillota bacterium]